MAGRRNQRAALMLIAVDAEFISALRRLALRLHYETFFAASLDEALRLLLPSLPLVILLGVTDAADKALVQVPQLRRKFPGVPVFLLPSQGSEELAIAALRADVDDYFRPPTDWEEIGTAMERLFNAIAPMPGSDEPEDVQLEEGNKMVGASSEVRGLKAYIQKLAASESNVLITGETGTGKELIAELIHKNSTRRNQPFMCINCAAIPDSLLESELFGHERGAFTGAHFAKDGKLAMGNNGSILLDEIGDMTPYAQAKILRAIEGKQVYRLGGREPIQLNVRILAATNRDLDAWATEDTFRKDLYFRLNVARVHLPPLRERKGDIPLLVRHYVRELNERFNGSVEGISDDVIEPLMDYHWPGNIRELRNVLESVFVSRPSRKITLLDLPEWFRKRVHAQVVSPKNEPELLLSALRATQWNKSKAAASLKWSRMTLYRKMAKYNLPKHYEAAQV